MPIRLTPALAALAVVAVAALVVLSPRTQPASAGEPTLIGDADCSGAVTSIDAALVLQLDAGLVASLPCEQNADVDEDGAINAIDAALILQPCVCPIDRLPPTLAPGSPTPAAPTATPDTLVGDANCDGTADAADSVAILRLVAGLLDSLPCQHNADVNGDGAVNAIDAELLIQFGVWPLKPL